MLEKIDWENYFMTIFMAGNYSAKDSESRCNNPYLYPSAEWIKWNEGFNAHHEENQEPTK